MRRMPTRFDEIGSTLQLALLLEVSSYPKPGNVHRTQDFDRTRFEHFLASAASLGPHFRLAAQRGRRIASDGPTNSELKIGDCIRCAVEASSKWQRGGNTSLGAVLLLVPMAYAAGMIPSDSTMRAERIRRNLKLVLRNTTSSDAAEVYRAISYASPGGLGRVPELDLRDAKSIAQIFDRNLSLLEVFRMSSKYDRICWEWTHDFSVTFDFGLPFLKREIRATQDVNIATVDTYLRILSRFPDTLIARKHDMKTARKVSQKAAHVLRMGGMKTPHGQEAVERMDRDLRTRGHSFNPGTTADLTACALAALLLDGYRP